MLSMALAICSYELGYLYSVWRSVSWQKSSIGKVCCLFVTVHTVSEVAHKDGLGQTNQRMRAVLIFAISAKCMVRSSFSGSSRKIVEV